MGRTKGSKNKSKELKTPIIIQKDIPDDFCKKKTVKVIGHNDWILTETTRGTPIAITGFSKSAQHCDLIVIPNYESKSYSTTVDSRSVLRPKFKTPDIEQEFNGVVFAQEE